MASGTPDERAYLSTAEVAQALNIKRETVYAYVSRGLLKPLERGGGRGSMFERAAVTRLRQRGRRARGEADASSWPGIETRVCEVDAKRLSYRGHDALELSRQHSFERVAELLWSAGGQAATPTWIAPQGPLAIARRAQAVLPQATLPVERMRISAAVLSARDPLRFDTARAPVLATARSLIAAVVESLSPSDAAWSDQAPAAPVSEKLFCALAGRRPTSAERRLLDQALVLCADQALSPSTLAVRVAAAQKADPYAVVQTGLGAMSGALHGAASLAAEDLLIEIESAGDVAQTIGKRLREQQRIPGFGHRVFVHGDPRARVLLQDVLRGGGTRQDTVAGLLEVMRTRALPEPNIDFALAALAHTHAMTRGASEALMSVARMAGWIAHALEEYGRPTEFPEPAS